MMEEEDALKVGRREKGYGGHSNHSSPLVFFKKSQFVKMRNLEKYIWVSGCCEQNVLPKLCLW